MRKPFALSQHRKGGRMNHQPLLTLIYSAVPCRRSELSVITKHRLFVFFFVSLSLRLVRRSRATSHLFLSDPTCLPDFGCAAMTSEECPAPLGSVSSSSAGPGQSEEYGPAHADDIIEEAGDDVSMGSDLSALVVPFPELAPVVFFCLKQTTCPRSWCIRMVSSPYPLSHAPQTLAPPTCTPPHPGSRDFYQLDAQAAVMWIRKATQVFSKVFTVCTSSKSRDTQVKRST